MVKMELTRREFIKTSALAAGVALGALPKVVHYQRKSQRCKNIEQKK